MVPTAEPTLKFYFLEINQLEIKSFAATFIEKMYDNENTVVDFRKATPSFAILFLGGL